MKVNKIEKAILVRALNFYMKEIKDPCRIVSGPAGNELQSVKPELEKLLEKVESLER